MRLRPLLTACAVGVVVLALGALLVARLMPASGTDGRIEPVILTPVGVSAAPSDGPSVVTEPTPTPTSPSATPPPRPRVTPPPPRRAVVPKPKPKPVKPSPRPVDDDDDDDDDDDGDDDDDD